MIRRKIGRCQSPHRLGIVVTSGLVCLGTVMPLTQLPADAAPGYSVLLVADFYRPPDSTVQMVTTGSSCASLTNNTVHRLHGVSASLNIPLGDVQIDTSGACLLKYSTLTLALKNTETDATIVDVGILQFAPRTFSVACKGQSKITCEPEVAVEIAPKKLVFKFAGG